MEIHRGYGLPTENRLCHLLEIDYTGPPLDRAPRSMPVEAWASLGGVYEDEKWPVEDS